MGPHKVIGWLITLLILPQRGGALTGKICSVRKLRSQLYTAYQSENRSWRFYETCGFLGWARCGRTRYHYVIESVTRTKQVYYAVSVCCPGWRVDKDGVKCSIHSQDPRVLYCPRGKSVRATGKTTQVTWKSPVFKEPHDFPMTVKSTYGREWARLAWGDTHIHYLATSSNNYRTVSCDFVVSVKPPNPTAIISGYSNGQTISVAENDRLVLECRAKYGLPPPRLRWYRNGTSVTNGTRYKTIKSDYLNFYHTVSTLTVVPSQADNDTRYTCQMVFNPVSYSVVLAVSSPVCDMNSLIGVDSPVVCATWSRSHVLLCIPVCPLAQDVLWTGLHPHLYICDLHGHWRPNPAPLNCSVVTGGVNSFTLPSYNYYNNASCTIDPQDFRSNMLTFASLSPYRALCLASGYVDQLDLSVHCP